MDKRPYSDEDIEQLKRAVYVPSERLHPLFVILLTIAWPLGLFYFFLKLSQKTDHDTYLLSQCKTEEEREALFAYLRRPPKVYQHNNAEGFSEGHLHLRAFSSNTYKSPFSDNIYRYGTAEYRAVHQRR